MLVLTRKPGESIRIGKDITITIVEGDGNSIKLGIDAPKHITVHREEVYQRIVKENQRAAQQNNSVNMGEFAKLFKK